jgi:hypothetical protein
MERHSHLKELMGSHTGNILNSSINLAPRSIAYLRENPIMTALHA